MNITSKTTFELTKIYFGDICHLVMVRAEVVGFQTWRTYQGVYSIEITFRSGATILTEYDQEDKWKTVISILEENLTK